MTTLPQATLEPGRTHSLRAALVCVGVGALVSALLFFEDSHVYLLFFGLLACLLLPVWISWSRKQLDYFEPVHLFGLVYFAYFGLGGIWTVQDPGNVAYDWNLVEYIPQAMFYGLIGHVLFLAGYYLPWRKRPLRRSPTTCHVRGIWLLVLCGVLGILAYLAQQSLIMRGSTRGQLPVLSTSAIQLRMFFLFAWSLAWLLFFGNVITRAQRWVLFGILLPGAALISYLTVSNKSLIMTLGLLPVVALWYTRGRIPWKSVTAILLLSIFVIFPFYTTYRNVAKRHTREVRLERTLHKLEKSSLQEHVTGSLTMFRTRLAMVNSLAIVLRDVPRWTPYAEGKTIFLPTLSLLVPRLIWPDKPVFRFNVDVGNTFRVTGVFNYDTFIALTTPGELYWNFSLPGIVIGMALMGVLLRAMYRRYGEARDVDVVTRAIYMTLLVPIAYVGGSIAVDLAEFSRVLLAMELARILFRYFGLIQVEPQPASAVEPMTAGASDRILPMPG